MDDVQQPVGIRGSRDAVYGEGMTSGIAPDYVFVLEFLEQANFANGGARDSFIFCFQPNLLEGDDLVRGYISGLVHDTVSSWENDGDQVNKIADLEYLRLLVEYGSMRTETSLAGH